MGILEKETEKKQSSDGVAGIVIHIPFSGAVKIRELNSIRFPRNQDRSASLLLWNLAAA